MLPRQPLRFLLADDPGTGKTIMARLFIKESRRRRMRSVCMIGITFLAVLYPLCLARPGELTLSKQDWTHLPRAAQELLIKRLKENGVLNGDDVVRYVGPQRKYVESDDDFNETQSRQMEASLCKLLVRIKQNEQSKQCSGQALLKDCRDKLERDAKRRSALCAPR